MQLDKIFHFDKKERQEVTQKKKVEYKKIGCMKHRNGHTLFSFNVKTGEWKIADVQGKAIINFDKTVTKEKKILIEKDCIYIEALNLKNAKKRLMRDYVKKTANA